MTKIWHTATYFKLYITALEFGINYLNVLPTLIFLNSMFLNLPDISRAILTSKMVNQSNPANRPGRIFSDEYLLHSEEDSEHKNLHLIFLIDQF